jgi:hypothetical protein
MQSIRKKTFLFLIFVFLIYCAIDIGTMWDHGTHLQMGKNKLRYLFSLGKINNEFFFSKYFPGVSYTITAFFVTMFPKKIESEILHLINLSISLSAVFGLSRIAKIFFNEKVANITFLFFLFYPAFFGHMAINPKDTVVTVSYIWITYLVIKYLKKPQIYQNKQIYLLKIGFLIALGTGVNLAFTAILLPLIIFIFTEIFYFKKFINIKFSKKIFIFDLLKIILLAYFILIIFWPQVHSNILVMPFKVFLETLENVPVGSPANLLNGEIYLINNSPKNYILLNLLLKSPEYLLILYPISFYFILVNNNFFKKKFTNFNYKLYFIILVFSLSLIMLTFSPYPLYDGMRKFMFLIPFFIFIPSLGMYFVICNNSLIKSKLCIFLILASTLIFLFKFFSLTPYQYVYLNYLNGKTSNNHLKFENDYLTTSIKELLKKSKFIDEKYIRLKFCGIGKGKIKKYLNKYNFSRVKLVAYEDEYDYVIMTNRVNWKSLNNLKKTETCFQTFNGKVVSQVKRNGLVLSAIKEKQ